MFTTVYLGIGTNKGDREKNIELALDLLKKNKNVKVLKLSNLLKNSPQEGIKTGYFLNGVIEIATSLSPFELLRLCKEIEKELGRKQSAISNQQSALRIKRPRTIDLDILFYGNEIIESEELSIPHPMLHKRYFVLIPLMEIGKDKIHPKLKKSVQELYEELTPTSIKNCASAV